MATFIFEWDKLRTEGQGLYFWLSVVANDPVFSAAMFIFLRLMFSEVVLMDLDS